MVLDIDEKRESRRSHLTILSETRQQQCPNVPKDVFPPTPVVYNKWPIVNKAALLPIIWPRCNAQYALCSYANCTLDFKGKEKSPILLAECGCVLPTVQNNLPPRGSLVDPVYILDRRLSREWKRQCAITGFGPSCLAPNGTAVCREIAKNTIYKGNYDYISTYSNSNSSGGFNVKCTATDPVQQMVSFQD